MIRQIAIILLLHSQVIFSQTSDRQFQVLVADNAKAYGRVLEPLQYIDDVTSIDISDNGFVALVHEGGTTFELKESIFTFYLEAEDLKERAERAPLDVLYKDSVERKESKNIMMLYPKFDAGGFVKWKEDAPVDLHWQKPSEPVLSYKVCVMDGTGKKIQDFGTTKTHFELKPYHLGLPSNTCLVQVSSSFDGKTYTSKRYQLELLPAPEYPVKASDMVLKALDLEFAPLDALEVWNTIFSMENGKYYFELYERFIQRNKTALSSSGEDVEMLLSQSK